MTYENAITTVYERNMLQHFSTIDAVEVIRCKNCKHYHIADNECSGECDRNHAKFYPWDYCSYGDKKEESNDGEPYKDCPH